MPPAPVTGVKAEAGAFWTRSVLATACVAVTTSLTARLKLREAVEPFTSLMETL